MKKFKTRALAIAGLSLPAVALLSTAAEAAGRYSGRL